WACAPCLPGRRRGQPCAPSATRLGRHFQPAEATQRRVGGQGRVEQRRARQRQLAELFVDEGQPLGGVELHAVQVRLDRAPVDGVDALEQEVALRRLGGEQRQAGEVCMRVAGGERLYEGGQVEDLDHAAIGRILP